MLANRLSENPYWKVLLLEAGGSESILSDIPLAAATLQMTPIDWAYQTEPQVIRRPPPQRKWRFQARQPRSPAIWTLFFDDCLIYCTIVYCHFYDNQEASCFGLINRRSRWPRGRVLGGSSVLNYMLYIRGNRRDYDNWVKLGATGWSWQEVFPYFLKSEDNRDPSIAYNGK